MKRFMFLTIVLILLASTTGCRRGLRLWGCRGAACQPAFGGMVAPPMAPAYPQLPAYQAPAAYPVCPPCPTYECAPTTECYIPEGDCGCASVGSVPAYSGFAPTGSQIVSDSGWDVRDNETFQGVTTVPQTATDFTPGALSAPPAPANVPPQLQNSSGFRG